MRVFVILAVCLAVAGCPRHKRKTLVPSVPTDGDPQARAKFVEARERFLRDGGDGDDLAKIAREYPDDPIAPFAGLYAGIAAVQSDELDVAVPRLEAVIATEGADPGLITRAELFLGIAHNGLGDAAKAVPLLARGEAAIEGDTERGLWIASSAAAIAATAPLDALPWLDRYWKIAVDSERGWILTTIEAIVAGAAPADATAAFEQLDSKHGPAAAVLGARLVELAAEQGDVALAAKLRASIADARDDLGLPALVGPVPDERAVSLAALLPLTGKQSRVAEAAARGLAIAAGAHGGASIATIDVVDVTGADATADAVSALADGAHPPRAILGPIDGDSVDAAAKRATERKVPLVSLNPRADERPEAGKWVFHAMHSAEARARVLARRADALGLRKVAILAPETGYGRAVATAFSDEVKAQGGKVVERVDYPADTKSFAKLVKKLDGSWDAVFIPDEADRLELIAPALAAAGLVPRAPGAKVAKKAGRAIVLLSTAEGMDAETIRDAGRHLVGGLLAPGFYPDESDPLIALFVDRYRTAYGELPTAVDAYAYDAAVAISMGELAQVEIDGVTGRLRFGKDHLRADDGLVFTVAEDGATVSTLR